MSAAACLRTFDPVSRRRNDVTLPRLPSGRFVEIDDIAAMIALRCRLR
jgi:hypothetical protein